MKQSIRLFVVCLFLATVAHAANKSAAQLAAEERRGGFMEQSRAQKEKAPLIGHETPPQTDAQKKVVPSAEQQDEAKAGPPPKIKIAGLRIGLPKIDRTMKNGNEEYLLNVPVILPDTIRDALVDGSKKGTLIAWFLSKFSDTETTSSTTYNEFGFYRYEQTTKQRGYIVGRITKEVELTKKVSNPTVTFLIAKLVDNFGQLDNIDVSGYLLELRLDGAQAETRYWENPTSVANLKKKYELPEKWWLFLNNAAERPLNKPE